MSRVWMLAVCIVIALVMVPWTGPVTAEPKTEVRGFGGFILGADKTSVMAIHPDLIAGSGGTVYSSKVPTTAYHSTTRIAAGGYTYPATLRVEFWQGKVAVVAAEMDRTAFAGFADWERAASALYNQLDTTYNTLTKRGEIGNLLIRVDANGNAIIFLSRLSLNKYVASDISVIYLWGPYYRAVGNAPNPATDL